MQRDQYWFAPLMVVQCSLPAVEAQSQQLSGTCLDLKDQNISTRVIQTQLEEHAGMCICAYVRM